MNIPLVRRVDLDWSAALDLDLSFGQNLVSCSETVY